MTKEIRIVFDGSPSPQGAYFVEVEDENGNAMKLDDWRDRPDGLVELVFPVNDSPPYTRPISPTLQESGVEDEHWMAREGRIAQYGGREQQDDDLPFRRNDVKRGLILFRTSNNAHGYTNFVSLTSKVDALPQVAKDELATLMRTIAEELSPRSSTGDVDVAALKLESAT